MHLLQPSVHSAGQVSHEPHNADISHHLIPLTSNPLPHWIIRFERWAEAEAEFLQARAGSREESAGAGAMSSTFTVPCCGQTPLSRLAFRLVRSAQMLGIYFLCKAC